MSKLNISRRDFLKAAGVSAAALGLTACGGSSSSTAASGSASAAGSTASAGGSNWPTDTVSFYVPAKAGGGTDMTARVFLQGINEVHPGNYIVVNDVTGGGTVAAENVRNAKPDGLNLLAYHTGLCTSIASGQYAHDLSEFTICGMFITVPDEATGGLFVPGNSKFDKLEDLIAYGKKIDHIQLNVAGIHNVSNALAAIASARELHIPMDIIKKGLMAFEGTDRRFEYKGQFNGVTVIDDYAHHPTEIKATLTAAQKYPHRQIWCVFQPHTYTRTKAFFHEFADALSLADKIVLADIYAARETDPGDIHSRDIQKLLLEKGKEAYYFPSFEEIEKFLREKCINGDLLITMGAGDVVLVGEALIK